MSNSNSYFPNKLRSDDVLRTRCEIQHIMRKTPFLQLVRNENVCNERFSSKSTTSNLVFLDQCCIDNATYNCVPSLPSVSIVTF